MKSKSLKDSIIGLFGNKTKMLQLNEIAKYLGIKATSEKYEQLKNALYELVDEGYMEKATRRKFSLVKKSVSNDIIGILRVKEDRGTVNTTSKDMPKISVKRKNMFTALDGDTVQVKLLAAKKEGKFQGEIVKVIQRQERTLVGNIEFDGNFYFLIPDDNQYLIDFLIPKAKLNGAKPNDKVSARFLAWDNPAKSPQAEVIEVLGQSGKPEVEFRSVIREFSLPLEFPQNVLDHSDKISQRVHKDEVARRLDLRKHEVITIDPTDAKDFDDALSLEKLENGNYLLGVHIADVSHYVTDMNPIDIEANKRGNSTYLVDCVIPMLPESLSNEICSLKPNRVRLTYSVMMEMTETGIIKKYEIVESIIKSVKRFTYDEVQKIIDTGTGPHKDLVLELHKLSRILRENRFSHGGINFQTVEVRFQLDENKHPVKALLKQAIPATELVEECMLIANKTVAEHIKKISKKYRIKEDIPFIYRVHAEPLPEKIKDALEFMKMLGPKHNFVINSSKDINRLLESFEETPEKPIVHQILVRSMPKAEYTDDNIGHYGLGFDDYAHFTSPIRRYPDLMVHRLLKEYNSGKPEHNRLNYLKHHIAGMGEHCTARERLSMEAERASTKLAQTIIAKDNMGKVFNGTITGVMNFGLFVTMDDIYAEGLLHIKDIYDDFYFFDERNLRIIGKRSGKIFQFGRRLRVKVANANIDKRKIDLDYAGEIVENQKVKK